MKIWHMRRQLSIGPEEGAVVVKEVFKYATTYTPYDLDKTYWIVKGMLIKPSKLEHWVVRRDE